MWAPLSTNDTTFNYFALMACQYLIAEFSELGWLEEAADIDGPTMADNEVFFDAAMTHICPELNYRRQVEWDNYIPFDLFDSTTTAPGAPAPQVPTTVPGIVTTLPPVAPGTTAPTIATTLPLAQPTTTTAALASEVMVLTGIDDAGNQVSVNYTCSDLNGAALQPPRACDEFEQSMFNRIVTTNGQAFQTFVELTTLGNFSTLPGIGHESRAWLGLVACVIRSTNPADVANVRRVFAWHLHGDDARRLPTDVGRSPPRAVSVHRLSDGHSPSSPWRKWRRQSSS